MVHYLPSCHSTNEIAQNLLQGPVEEGTIVITDHQFEGKGQRGNVWQSEPFANLTFSLILKPEFLKARDQFGLTMSVSLGIKYVLEHHLPGDVQIKWPNDILFRQKKIAGILIENNLKGQEVDSVAIGIGLNINQVQFEGLEATSMKLSTDKNFVSNNVLNELVAAIGDEYTKLRRGYFRDISIRYHEALYGIGEERRFMSKKEFFGTIAGTDKTGRLIVKTASGDQIFQNKEISFLF